MFFGLALIIFIIIIIVGYSIIIIVTLVQYKEEGGAKFKGAAFQAGVFERIAALGVARIDLSRLYKPKH